MTKRCPRRFPAAVFFPRVAALTAGLALLAAALAPAAVAGEEVSRTMLRGAGPGEVVEAPEGRAEVVQLEGDLVGNLLDLRVEETARVADWPVAPDVRRDVLLTRHEIYAPEARIYKVEGSAKTELRRSNLVFFWGAAEGDDDVRVFAAVDPATGELKGFARSADGVDELRPLSAGMAARLGASAAAGRHLVASPEAFLAAGKRPLWKCGQEDLPRGLEQALAPRSTATASAALSGLYTATMGVDTDTELLSLKFGGNTTSESNYIASLFAAMNVMYERDLQIRLLQGTTFLRVASDPWNQSASGEADGNKLNEFANWWSANEVGVPRTLAMMLSGKEPSNNSASGIAAVGTLCSTGAGYSFSQVFKIDYLAGDALVVGHEIGHNFGSVHTHCYSPPIDMCFNGESGCYSGPTSCPAPMTMQGVPNVTGTVMSYCQFLGCTNLVFHPRTVAVIAPDVAAAIPPNPSACIFPLSTAPTVVAIKPNNGSTAGGTAVTLSGSNFQNGATVTIGGVAATAVVVVNAATITATTGAHATGAASVTVTDPGPAAATLSNSYFYAPPSAALSFFTVTPCRVIDTRSANGPHGGPVLAASAQRAVAVAGTCGIPAAAKYVSANVTITGPTGAGSVNLFPGNAFPLGTSTIGFSPGQTRANNAIVLLATDGSGNVLVQNAAAGNTQFILDVNGYFQ